MTEGPVLMETVGWFAAEMLNVLERPKNRSKRHWAELTDEYLLLHLQEELGELVGAARQRPALTSAVVAEAVDLANVAMMVADNAVRRLAAGRAERRDKEPATMEMVGVLLVSAGYAVPLNVIATWSAKQRDEVDEFVCRQLAAGRFSSGDPVEIPPKPECLIQKCRDCGCTEDMPCITVDGPCHWVNWDLCSACAPEGREG